MKRDSYYPRRLAERPEWHINFAAKLQIHGPPLNLTAGQINNAVADNLTLAYGLGDWLTNVRDLGPTATASLKLLRKGTGRRPMSSPPTPPPPRRRCPQPSPACCPALWTAPFCSSMK
jgi:hypothetical protein